MEHLQMQYGCYLFCHINNFFTVWPELVKVIVDEALLEASRIGEISRRQMIGLLYFYELVFQIVKQSFLLLLLPKKRWHFLL